VKIPVYQQFLKILRPARLAPTTMMRSKSLQSPFFYSDAQFELQKIILTMSTCLSCCHLIGWSDICVH